MTPKAYFFLVCILTTLCAGSVTFNVIQIRAQVDPALQIDRTNILTSIVDIRRTGTLVANNINEGSFIISYEDSPGKEARMKVWFGQGGRIQHLEASTTPEGVIQAMKVSTEAQQDLKVGETVYMAIAYSVERSRLETTLVLTGSPLPHLR